MVVSMSSHTKTFEVLAEDECLRLLAAEPVGRMGFSAGALPVVMPINIAVDGQRIVFASEPGLKLDAARAGDVACIEVDGFDRFAHTGWSVLATGRLREITDPADRERAARLPVVPWAIPTAEHFVELSIELLSGRRVGIPTAR
jgi:nitroimidazol reductase NimA-like FMN-containing flavoprotein (pyridoxamine 5'-phosphate oxidase superfamily)